jgi:hypothetical protein
MCLVIRDTVKPLIPSGLTTRAGALVRLTAVGRAAEVLSSEVLVYTQDTAKAAARHLHYHIRGISRGMREQQDGLSQRQGSAPLAARLVSPLLRLLSSA